MLEETYGKYLNSLAKEELVRILLSENEEKIPITIFLNEDVAPLESLVKFLKENKGLSLQKIAERLGRSGKTIWTTYNNAKKKRLRVTETQYNIPIAFFSRKMSILESTVYYLKTRHEISFHQIAVLLKRDDRTIWTLYNRGCKKNG